MDVGAATGPLRAREIARLREIRLTEGWSFREMAARMSLTESTVQNLLAGNRHRHRETTLYRVRRWLASYTPPVAEVR
jgi:transcriptional regulator with XRE-family HTH domain